MNKERFKPLSEWLDSLPEPKTPWDKFICWLSNLIDDITIRKSERRMKRKR